MRYPARFLILSLTLVVHAAGAEEAAILDRSRLIAIAEQSSPSLQAARARWEASVQMAPQVGSLPDPRISYGYFVEPVHTRVGPQQHRIEITQTIPLFGKLSLRSDAANWAASGFAAAYEHELLELRFRIESLWAELYYLDQSELITGANLELLEHLESVILAQYAAGRAPHSTLIRVQLERGKLEDRQRSLADRRRPLIARLDAELGGTLPSAELRATDLGPSRSLGAAGEWIDLLDQGSPQLRRARAGLERQKVLIRLANRSPIPDLMIGGELVQVGEPLMANTPNAGADAIIVKASISIPLWTGRYRAERAQANAEAAAVESDLRALHERLKSQIEQIHFEARDSQRKVQLYEETLLPKARDALAVTERAFTGGQASFLDWIDAQRTLLEFELMLERARADYAIRIADLQRLVGPASPQEGQG